jgi:hypothetical protein
MSLFYMRLTGSYIYLDQPNPLSVYWHFYYIICFEQVGIRPNIWRFIRVMRNLRGVQRHSNYALVAYAMAHAMPASEIISLVLTAVLVLIPVVLPATFMLASALAARALARQGLLDNRTIPRFGRKIIGRFRQRIGRLSEDSGTGFRFQKNIL